MEDKATGKLAISNQCLQDTNPGRVMQKAPLDLEIGGVDRKAIAVSGTRAMRVGGHLRSDALCKGSRALHRNFVPQGRVRQRRAAEQRLAVGQTVLERLSRYGIDGQGNNGDVTEPFGQPPAVGARV